MLEHLLQVAGMVTVFSPALVTASKTVGSCRLESGFPERV